MGLWIIWGFWVLAIFYLLVFFVKARYAFAHKEHDETTSTLPQSAPSEGVSVIICARNELANLQALLPLLYQQDYDNYEIIVVEDCSTDGSLDFLLAEKSKNPKLKIVWLRHRPRHIRGKKYALSLGIRAARHDRLLLTDADCRPLSDTWVAGMASQLQEPYQIVLGYSPYLRQSGLLNAYIRYETLLTGGMYLTAALDGYPYMGVGRNLAYRKSLFMQHKGFYPHLHITGGDDDLFVNRHATAENTTTVTAKSCQVYSKPKTSWQQYYRQKLRHLSVGRYYKKKDQRWVGFFSASHFIFWMGLFSLILVGHEPIFIISGLMTKWFSQFLFLRITVDKLKDPINLALLPILDFLYVIYYVILGIRALSSNNTEWN